MRSEYMYHGIPWIDLESPTRHEVREIMERFGISPHIAEELLLPSTKARMEFSSEYIYAIMHFPALRHSHKTLEQEIDFVVGKNFIITAHYEAIESLHQFTKVLEVNSVLDKDTLGSHAGYLFFYMVRRLYKAVEHEIELVRQDMTHIEHRIFSGEEREMVEAISRSARDLLNLRQTIEPHREVLQEFEGASKFFGTEFTPFVRSLANEYYRVHNHIMRQTESLRELRETNNSLLSTKQNEVMKLLTIMTFITAPLALAAAIFGMSGGGGNIAIPLITEPYGFWTILVGMALAAALLFIFFKRKSWL